jgi:hypothetical protein
MRHGCTVAAAATFIAGFALIPANVRAACDQHTGAGCTATPQPSTAANPQPSNAAPSQPSGAANPQPSTASPLRLKRFMAVGPARRSASRSPASRSPVSHSPLPRVVRLPPQRPERTADAARVGGPFVPVPDATPLTPKVTPTVSIPAAASGDQDRTVGSAARTEPSRSDTAFAHADETAKLPPGVRIARFGEVNEIDLAADATSKPAQKLDQFEDLPGVLVTPARAAPSSKSRPAPPPSSAEPEPANTSWLSWAYGKLVDGVLTVVLAIRSIFV